MYETGSVSRHQVHKKMNVSGYHVHETGSASRYQVYNTCTCLGTMCTRLVRRSNIKCTIHVHVWVPSVRDWIGVQISSAQYMYMSGYQSVRDWFVFQISSAQFMYKSGYQSVRDWFVFQISSAQFMHMSGYQVYKTGSAFKYQVHNLCTCLGTKCTRLDRRSNIKCTIHVHVWVPSVQDWFGFKGAEGTKLECLASVN